MIKKQRFTGLLLVAMTSGLAEGGEAYGNSSGNFLDGIGGGLFGGAEGSSSGSGGANPLAGSGWDITGAAGVSIAKGNADSLSFSVQGLATYKGPVWESLIGADYFFSENDDVTATDSLRIFGQSQRLLTERLYLGLAGSFLRDDIADLEYRVDVASVLGYHLIKTDRTTLSIEVGPGFTWEEQGGITDQYANIRFSERFEHKLSKRSKIWQSAIFTPEISDFDNYNLIVEAGLDVLLTDKWSFRTGVRYLFDNTPAAGQQSDDVTLTAGLAYSLGGFPDPAEEGRATLKPAREEPAVAALGWTTTAALGVSLAQGNAESLLANVSYDTVYRTSTDEFFLNGTYAFGENDGERSVDSLRVGTRYNRLLSDRVYVGGGVDYLRDDIADLDFRLTGTAYAGYYVIKNDTMSLAFEGGPGYIFEESAGEQDDYFSVRFAERFSWILGPRTTFKQDAIVDLDPDDIDNAVLTATAYLDTDITDNLTWRLAGTYVFDNQPEAGIENEDFTLTSGIAVQF